MPMPIVSRYLHKPLNLALDKVFPGPIVAIWEPTADNCSLLSSWSAGAGYCIHWNFPLADRLTVLIIIIENCFQMSDRLLRPCAPVEFAAIPALIQATGRRRRSRRQHR